MGATTCPVGMREMALVGILAAVLAGEEPPLTRRRLLLVERAEKALGRSPRHIQLEKYVSKMMRGYQ